MRRKRRTIRREELRKLEERDWELFMEREAKRALISVIVPVYNVVPWLNRCVESIVNQTWRALEILLVDDGSTDGSGAMCDAWAEKDSRIRVIHKPNGGLSDARNVGLDTAQGDYISFIDSDDWADVTMLEVLYSAMREADADMAVCNRYAAYDGRNVSPACSGRSYVLTGEQALERVILDKPVVVSAYRCWAKLFKRDVWDGLRFPTGKQREDKFIRCRTYARCKRISVVDRPLFYYYQRPDSLAHSFSEQIALDSLEGVESEYRFLKAEFPALKGTNAIVMRELLKNYCGKWCDDAPKVWTQAVEARIRELFPRYKKGVWHLLSITDKVFFLLFSISPSLAYVVGRAFYIVKWKFFSQKA